MNDCFVPNEVPLVVKDAIARDVSSSSTSKRNPDGSGEVGRVRLTDEQRARVADAHHEFCQRAWAGADESLRAHLRAAAWFDTSVIDGPEQLQ